MALCIALVCLLIDQTGKAIILGLVMQPPRVIAITPFFSLTLQFNSGVSFGMFSETLAEWPQLFTVVKTVIAVGLLLWAVRTPYWNERIGLPMIAGGALGNALDRWRQGAVTDFLDFHWNDWHWPTFNLADVAIVMGAGLMIFAMLPAEKGANRP